jgi:metal-dependent amidase/aminoacylase/carboxypeptidase family protein
VEKGICDLPFAFRARAACQASVIACEHNIIAASALGAAFAAAKVADELGPTVSVIGTQAEEAGNASGKILLLAPRKDHRRKWGSACWPAYPIHRSNFAALRLNGVAAANAIPAHTPANMIRSETLDQLAELRPKAYRCFEAGGLATGAKAAIRGGDKPYDEMRRHTAMAALYRRNSEELGRPFPNLGRMGNAANRFH